MHISCQVKFFFNNVCLQCLVVSSPQPHSTCCPDNIIFKRCPHHPWVVDACAYPSYSPLKHYFPEDFRKTRSYFQEDIQKISSCHPRVHRVHSLGTNFMLVEEHLKNCFIHITEYGQVVNQNSSNSLQHE